MSLYALGLNHNTAPLALREQLTFPVGDLAESLAQLRDGFGVEEAALLSTCNRTELYCKGGDPLRVAQWMAWARDVSFDQLRNGLYTHADAEAVRHIFRVACGLDSMVLGEPQILGQLKGAVRFAESAGALGSNLHKLFQQSFSVAKQVRSHTELGYHTVSMAAASVQLAARIFERMSDVRVLFVGAGEMVELCAAHFAGAHPKGMAVVNRSRVRAETLAERFPMEVLPLESLADSLPAHDVVISCTASPVPLIGQGMVARALRLRRRRPMVMVDLAVPRDIEPEVGRLDDIFLYTVDDLERIVSLGHESRQAAAAEAEAMVELEVDNYWRWLARRDALPAIRLLREHVEQMRQVELQRAKRMLARGDDPERVIDAITQALGNKLLHEPTRYLNQAEGQEIRHAVATVQQVFGLPADSSLDSDS
ncbi:MAG: glutamyl-tRNA reductase [Candidatus Dactylopiibacterium carminicum]|uniref:Glutamyl-tRNA reductase n=1 Tax=Candidatus Dactylopiibacterium carminicum TaxID=857335 RepID=A0A272EQC5_9RHOO|nr:glutamyl-tRNA reductase [Candidatus Dactylopiibacterium carminicum]KAF7598556.1 glutamyl-tRNA reductase [Candidatus Dactylopiibacterium carminicum]PAS92313.1 MAG: glutamyl-tRNA reductase [Candidatus Dactylopiibacterium carminicum]PAS95898.1 MAG: glutamyl-tRNA reductase [Candidatus Dactylopiibacterium carminicum]PAS98116.1 MAG: glutamyl-tRNA reductase [Candidatus Dactylopiibacterium carminicum]